MNKPFHSLDSLYSHRWIQAELSYIRGIIHELLDQEAQASPLIAPALQGIKASSGKMLRPLLCILGARCAGGKEFDYDSLASGPNLKELQSLEKTSHRWIRALKETSKIENLTQQSQLHDRAGFSSELDRWKQAPPFGGALPNAMYLVAAGIELLHLATLVHDDVIDDSDTRRGKPAVWKQIGRRHAVLLGDLLMSLCFALVSHGAGVETGQILSGMVRVMARCEFLQAQERLDFQSSLANPSRRRYNRVITGKTALLFSLALSSGATEMTRYLYRNSDDQSNGPGKLQPPFLQHLRRGGYCLGTGFQIQDDMLDLLGNTSFGKPLGQDLRDKQITLPLIEALLASSWGATLDGLDGSDSANGSAGFDRAEGVDSVESESHRELRTKKQELIDLINTFQQGDESVLSSITQLIDQLGGFARSDHRSNGLLNQASKEFDLACKLQETPGTKELLDLLMVFLLNRKY